MTFKKTEQKFKQKLEEFAADGYRFSNGHSLYKETQKEAFQGYLGGIKEGNTHGYIELPTGVGKTALFISLIKNYLNAGSDDPNAPRVLITVPTEKLAIQTAQAIAKFMPEIAKTIEADGDSGQEIDWGKSDIGLQYSKMKHADKKPKVLITTYQSLAKDNANKTYPPKDYGFVIYDEGHMTTAPIFGKAIDKFHDSVQLAVTATPEYTEEKTVAKKLPHRYYQLSLAEAINRGDLCNVRPAIIKTGYKLDEKLFQKFMDQQAGTPLNTQQLQQLLNQESRNKAIIETYMRGSDPDSKERYFGQNGMIFCTGIEHANSIAEQFTKALQKPGEGQELKKWLNEENIELIAAVHGKADGAWLKKGLLADKPTKDRKFMGNTEWYSEEEIFDLHERGKILLLASVAKLKAGYDSPRDSLLFDLADRFSKVDATQIDGRAFRLDPDNPNKTATVFNLMDDNTQDLYNKYPKLKPIYCAEVIEGAEFRPPARRIHAQVRFKKPPPEMEKTLQEAGFDIITDIDAVRTISRDNKQKRDQALFKYPDKTNEWLGPKDMALVVSKSPVTMFPIYNALQNAWKEATKQGNPTFSAEGVTLSVEKAGLYRNHKGATSFCLHKDAASHWIIPEKTSEWLNITDMEPKVGKARETLLPHYKALEKAWDEARKKGESTFKANGISLKTSQAGIFRNSRVYSFCLHEDIVPHFASAPKKSSEWLNAPDMANRVDRSHPTLLAKYKPLEKAWKEAIEQGNKTFSAGGITLKTTDAKMLITGSSSGFCLHENTVQHFMGAPKKTAEWFASTDMAEPCGKSSATVLTRYKLLEKSWEEAVKDKRKTFSACGMTFNVEDAKILSAGPGDTFCMHERTAPAFKKHFAEPRKKISGNFVDSVSQSSIAPQSDHLKRTGRVRGKQD